MAGLRGCLYYSTHGKVHGHETSGNVLPPLSPQVHWQFDPQRSRSTPAGRHPSGAKGGEKDVSLRPHIHREASLRVDPPICASYARQACLRSPILWMPRRLSSSSTSLRVSFTILFGHSDISSKLQLSYHRLGASLVWVFKGSAQAVRVKLLWQNVTPGCHSLTIPPPFQCSRLISEE